MSNAFEIFFYSQELKLAFFWNSGFWSQRVLNVLLRTWLPCRRMRYIAPFLSPSPVIKLSLFLSLLVCHPSSLYGRGGRGGGWSQSWNDGKPGLHNQFTTLCLIILSSEFLDLSGLFLSLSGPVLLCSGLLSFWTYVRSSCLFKNLPESEFFCYHDTGRHQDLFSFCFCRGQIRSPWRGGEGVVDSGIAFLYRPASLCRLLDRYNNPMPESTLSPKSGTMNLTTEGVIRIQTKTIFCN